MYIVTIPSHYDFELNKKVPAEYFFKNKAGDFHWTEEKLEAVKFNSKEEAKNTLKEVLYMYDESFTIIEIIKAS